MYKVEPTAFAPPEHELAAKQRGPVMDERGFKDGKSEEGTIKEQYTLVRDG